MRRAAANKVVYTLRETSATRTWLLKPPVVLPQSSSWPAEVKRNEGVCVLLLQRNAGIPNTTENKQLRKQKLPGVQQ